MASGITAAFDGDSLTAGVGTVGPTTRWPNVLLAYPEWTSRTITYVNNAVSGQTCSQRVSAYPGQGHLISPAVTGTPGTYFIWIGTNDLVAGTAASTIYTCISGFWSTLKTDGWTVVASTLQGISSLEPSSVFDMLQRQTLNDSIRSAGVSATTYDYLMDPDTIYRDPHNTVWMQSDGTHPNVAGNAYFAAYVNGLIWSHGFVSGTPGPQKDSGMGTGGGNFRTSQWSLYSLTNGIDNTASGIGTLGLCAGCTGVTAEGFGSGPSITSGFYDTLYGYGTGNALTGSASEVSAFGYRSLAALAINNTNTTSAFGWQSGLSCTSCTASFAFGGSADLGAAVANAGQLGAGQNTQSNTLQWLTLTLESKAAFTVAGCGTATSLLGSGLAGQFTGGSATCTPVVTTGLTAPNGYSCWINDETTATALFHQTAHNATTVTFTAAGTVGGTDVINFGCKEF